MTRVHANLPLAQKYMELDCLNRIPKLALFPVTSIAIPELSLGIPIVHLLV